MKYSLYIFFIIFRNHHSGHSIISSDGRSRTEAVFSVRCLDQQLLDQKFEHTRLFS